MTIDSTANGGDDAFVNNDLPAHRLYRVFRDRMRIVIIISVVTAVIFFGIAMLRAPSYTAVAAFVPQTIDSRAAGSAASLAAQFGISLPSDQGAQSPLFYGNLVRSLSLLRKVVETEYTTTDKKNRATKSNLIEIIEAQEEAGRPAWRIAADEVRDNLLHVKVDNETGLVELTFTAPDPHVAEQVLTRMLGLLDEFVITARQARARNEQRFMGERVADSRVRLTETEDALQQFLISNRDFRTSPTLLFEHERLERQVLMRQEVYTALLRAAEQARLDALRDTPLLSVVQPSDGTSERDSRHSALWAIIGLLLGGAISMLYFIGPSLLINKEAGRHPMASPE